MLVTYILISIFLLVHVHPNNLKLADVTPIYKKGSHTDKENYRPVSILTSLSKVFERLLYRQMYSFTESILSINQCGFRKGFSAQHCSITMLEKWRTSADNKLIAGILLTDLSKTFIHDLLIAKLHAYGFDYNALLLIHNYLYNHNQGVKVNSCSEIYKWGTTGIYTWPSSL